MKKFIPILLGLGAGAIALADQPSPIPSPTKSERNFRFKQAGSNGVALVDLVVAYDEPTGLAFVDKLGKSITKEQFLTDIVFATTSAQLFTASRGAVQLGRIAVVPISSNADADIVILLDPSATVCPGNLSRPGDAADVCADANTGGFLGLGWWRPTTKIDGSVPGPTDDVIFNRRDIGGKKISNTGAQVRVSWRTLIKYPSTALIHEFGHYLFGMRDEYEGQTFSTQNAYAIAGALDVPNPLSGVSLAGADVASLPLPFLNSFKGYGMSYLSEYNAAFGYSPKLLPLSGSLLPEGLVGPADDQVFGVSEQTSTHGTRGDVDTRYGGMWSLETAIRTGKCEGVAGCTYTPAVASATVVHVPDSVKVDFYSTKIGNIFMLDNSGSMSFSIAGDNPQSLVRWDAAVDFFGRMTHPLDGSNVSYPAGSKFGLLTFATDVVFQKPYNSTTTLADITAYTKAYSGPKLLSWQPTDAPAFPFATLPADRRGTNIVGAMAEAKTAFANDLDKPFRRNVVLISDGKQELYEWQTLPPYNLGPVTGREGLEGGYRIFAISVDAELNDGSYGTMLSKLAQNSQSLDGEKGAAYFTNGDNPEGLYEGSTQVTPKLTYTANLISNAINKFTNNSLPPSSLFQDAAKEYSLATDKGMTSAQFAVAWAGADVPTLWLYDPDNRTYPEGNTPGIVFKRLGNMKTFDVDLTQFKAGTWRVQAKSSVWDHPISIYPSISTKSSNLKVRVNVDPNFIASSGRLPVDVVVKDGRSIEGLVVTAVLLSRRTGVRQEIPLAWNGASYSGALSGTLQPGVSDLTVKVMHPNNGQVAYAKGENNLPASLRTQYPYFEERVQSQEIWVPGGAPRKIVQGLEAWTLQGEVGRATGTRLTLFLKNGSTVPWTGLRARYFFSLTESPNGVAAFSPTYLAGNSKVKVGTVDRRPGLGYVEFDFAGQTLQPGQSSSNGVNGGEGGYVIKSDWQGPWETANDYSFTGLKTTWAANSFINIYDAAGKLVAGNPDMDPPGNATNAAPVVQLVVPTLVVAGYSATYTANAVDPDGDAMTYKWSINGTVVGGSTSTLVYTISAAGTYSVSVEVADGHGNFTTSSSSVTVQPSVGACTETNSREIGSVSTNQVVSLIPGANCFVIKAPRIFHEWNWTKLQFQVNSDNGVVLAGLGIQSIPAGTVTNLAGYSQTVPFADPGRGKNLYLKLQANSARTVRLNWWLQ